MSDKKEINILYTYIEANTGYGLSAKKMIDMFNKLDGINIDPLPLNKPNIINDKKLKDHYDIFINHVSVGILINDIENNGYLKMCMSRCDKKYQYLLWETDRLPSSYDNFFKTNFIDGFICPSIFIVDMVKKYNKEIHYIPITVDENSYNKEMRVKSNDDIFTVLTVAQLSVRKAIDVSTCVFSTAFHKISKNVRYYIKIGEKIDNVDVENLIKGNIARAMLTNPGNIYIIDNNLSDEEMKKLYLESHCYLHLSRGEGFGITPLTAISYGLRVLYSQWSGHLDYLKKDKNSVPVEGWLDNVHSMDTRYGFEPEMRWCEINQSDAVEKLRKMYDDWTKNKFDYSVPDVVNEYKEENVIKKVANFIGMKDIKYKNINIIDGVNVISF